MDVPAEDQVGAGDVLHRVDEGAVAIASGDPLALEETERMRSGRADAQALVAGNAADVPADLRSWSATSPVVWHTGVAISSTDCISSALITGSSSCPATAASTVSMCCTRSNVSASRSMYSSSTPSVYGSLLPKA